MRGREEVCQVNRTVREMTQEAEAREYFMPCEITGHT